MNKQEDVRKYSTETFKMINKEKVESASLSYDTYLKERESLINSELEGSKSFDKFILTLSAGAIGLSLTFIDKLISGIYPGTIWLLGIAWVSLVMSMLFTLLSLLTSQSSCRKQRDILDKIYNNQTSDVEQTNVFSTLTNGLNIFSMGFFIMGVILLLTFCTVNIAKGEFKMAENKKDKITEGGFSAQKVPEAKDLKEGIVAQKAPEIQKNLKDNSSGDKEKGFVAQPPPQPPKTKDLKDDPSGETEKGFVAQPPPQLPKQADKK